MENSGCHTLYRMLSLVHLDTILQVQLMVEQLGFEWHMNCNYVETRSSDKIVRLWDVQNGECIRIFIGYRSMILSLAMSPDGRYMASSDEDGSIMMWDISNGRCVPPLVGHTSCVWSLAFSCEGSLLASGSTDSTVKLWDVNTSVKTPKTEDKVVHIVLGQNYEMERPLAPRTLRVYSPYWLMIARCPPLTFRLVDMSTKKAKQNPFYVNYVSSFISYVFLRMVDWVSLLMMRTRTAYASLYNQKQPPIQIIQTKDRSIVWALLKLGFLEKD
ncbi:hypothetical protein Lser_V15G08604 [Lactuca serriola]